MCPIGLKIKTYLNPKSSTSKHKIMRSRPVAYHKQLSTD